VTPPVAFLPLRCCLGTTAALAGRAWSVLVPFLARLLTSFKAASVAADAALGLVGCRRVFNCKIK